MKLEKKRTSPERATARSRLGPGREADEDGDQRTKATAAPKPGLPKPKPRRLKKGQTSGHSAKKADNNLRNAKHHRAAAADGASAHYTVLQEANKPRRGSATRAPTHRAPSINGAARRCTRHQSTPDGAEGEAPRHGPRVVRGGLRHRGVRGKQMPPARTRTRGARGAPWRGPHILMLGTGLSRSLLIPAPRHWPTTVATPTA